MNRLAALLTCLLWAAPAGAQIAVPPTVPPHRPIVATIDVAGAAAGSVQVLWEADEATALEVIGDGGRVHCWAPPGEHWLRCNVFRVDWESRQFRVEQHRAAFRVDGATPGPDPPEPGPAPPPVDPPGQLAALLPAGADRAKFAEFYRDLAAVVEAETATMTTGQFREVQRLSVERFKAERRLPDAPALNKPISDRIAAAIGMDDRPMDTALKAELVAALRRIAEDF